MGRLVRDPRFWLAGFSLWFVVLWLASSGDFSGPRLLPVAHLDKVQHFGYFFGGSGLWCAGWFCWRPQRPAWGWIMGSAVVVAALVGWLDEYHQTFTPGRSGNDAADWLADVAGAAVGALVFRRWHGCLK